MQWQSNNARNSAPPDFSDFVPSHINFYAFRPPEFTSEVTTEVDTEVTTEVDTEVTTEVTSEVTGLEDMGFNLGF